MIELSDQATTWILLGSRTPGSCAPSRSAGTVLMMAVPPGHDSHRAHRRTVADKKLTAVGEGRSGLLPVQLTLGRGAPFDDIALLTTPILAAALWLATTIAPAGNGRCCCSEILSASRMPSRARSAEHHRHSA